MQHPIWGYWRQVTDYLCGIQPRVLPGMDGQLVDPLRYKVAARSLALVLATILKQTCGDFNPAALVAAALVSGLV